jgi:hypothetical protein
MTASISSELTIGRAIIQAIESKKRPLFLLKAAIFIFNPQLGLFLVFLGAALGISVARSLKS